MGVPLRHVLEQGATVRALGAAAIARLEAHRRAARRRPSEEAPGPWLTQTIAPRPEDLVRAYVRNAGGDPSSYRGRVPGHMFPQWGLPLVTQVLAPLPYPFARVVNAGCRIDLNAPLPAGAPLVARARLESIDDDGKRALLTARVVTGTSRAPDAVVADVIVLVPLAKKSGAARPEKTRATVPADAREIAFFRLGRGAGLDFAKLTGDFNPVHWVPAYAKWSGFRGCILHGFGTLARALEAANRALFAGDPSRLARVEARFRKPLVLPADVGVYVGAEGRIWVGDAPAGSAYLEGRLETTERTS